jgi:hypothetical protein
VVGSEQLPADRLEANSDRLFRTDFTVKKCQQEKSKKIPKAVSTTNSNSNCLFFFIKNIKQLGVGVSVGFSPGL